MLSFKEFLSEMFLFEATGKHFAHIAGFDENNPEHQDLVHAFNQSGFPTNHASRIKSMDELKDKVAPKLQALHQARAEEKEHQAAIARGDAELVHHDPEKGIKVFKVKNQAGGCAVGKGTKWCIADPKSPDDMVRDYDPEGNSSHVIHFDKEKGNLSRIAMIGVNYSNPHESGVDNNFQDKGNVTVSDSDWNHLRKKYKLDSIPALSGIRGIAPSKKDKDELEKNLTHTKPYIRMKAIKNPDVTAEHISRALEDEDGDVRQAAISNKNATAAHIDKALEDEDPWVREEAIRHRNATAKHISRALEDKDPFVRESAVRRPNATAEHIQTALKDSDETVKTIAQMRKDSGDYIN